VDEPGPISPPGPSSSPAADAHAKITSRAPLDVKSLIEERSKALHAQNSVVNMRTRETVKVLKRKIREMDKLAADRCVPRHHTFVPCCLHGGRKALQKFDATSDGTCHDICRPFKSGCMASLLHLSIRLGHSLHTISACRGKDPNAVIRALHSAATSALHEQILVEKKAAEAQTERDTAAELLAAKDKEARISQNLVARLQELCRELHKQNKQARPH
jgi:hypothetical protein